MPAALGATAFTVGATAVTYGAVLQTTLIVGSAIHARRQARKARRRALDAIQDQTIMVRTATAVRPIVLGSARISGPIFPLGKSGPDGERLHFVLPLAGPSDGVNAIYVGDDVITDWDADGWVTAGKHVRTWQEPAFETMTVNGSRQITLSQEATAILAIAPMVTGDTDSTGFYLGNPATDLNAYSMSLSVGQPTVLTFHTSRVGMTLVVSYKYQRSQSYLRVKFHDGQSGQAADSYLMQELPARWTSGHIGFGVSYLAVTMVYHPDVWPTGIPNFSADIRGDRIRDTRSGTDVHTTNNALHARYLLKAAFRCTDSEIDDALIGVAANACDEAVQTDAGTTEPRYTFHGSLPTSMSPKDMLEAVLDAMMGYAVCSGGKWRVYSGVWRPPTLVLGDEDFANDTIVVQGRQGRREMTNCARARYQRDDGIITDAPAWVSPTYVAEDKGEEAFVDLDLQFTRGVHRAQRIEKRTVLQARQAMTVSGAYKMSAYEVTAGDIVELTLSTHGVVDKPFLVAQADRDPMGSGIRLAMREVAEAIDDWTFDEARNPDPAPNTSLPDHRIVATPVLTFNSGSQFATTLADGSQRPYLRVYWQPFDVSVDQIELWWRRAGETTWQQQKVPVEQDAFDIYGVSGSETYIVIGRAINGIGVRSTWAAYSVAVDTSAPANAGSVTLGIGANQMTNAKMANGTEKWRLYTQTDGGITLSTGADYTQQGTYGEAFGWAALGKNFTGYRPDPMNGLVVWTSSGPAYAPGARCEVYHDEHFIACSPGDRIEAQAMVGGVGAGANLAVVFVDAAGALVQYATLNGSPVMSPSEGRTGYTGLGNFKHVWGFATTPVGAAKARWSLLPSRTITSGGSSLSIGLPYLGIAHAGQTQPTEWHPGPSGGAIEGLDAVDTGEIMPEAATEVIEAYVAGPITILGQDSAPSMTTLIQQYVYCEPGCTISATITFDFELAAPASNNVYLQANWFVTASKLPVNVWAGDGTQRGSVADTLTFESTNPVSTPHLVRYRANQVGAGGPVTPRTVSNIRLRVEVIKR